jgi:hypothetical protein
MELKHVLRSEVLLKDLSALKALDSQLSSLVLSLILLHCLLRVTYRVRFNVWLIPFGSHN